MNTSESSDSESSDSEQQSIYSTEPIEKLSNKISKLRIPSNINEPIKKRKINPFEGGISNSAFIKKKEDNSLDIKQIFKNKHNIEIILDFLTNKNLNGIKGIILRGNIGCGKMTLVKACLKQAGYTNTMYDADSEIENIFENLLLTIEIKGFQKFQKSTMKKSIIIKDIDGTLKPTQKSEFFKFLINSKNALPVIMTSTDRSVGTFREVPKGIIQIEFENPSNTELVRHFSHNKISKSALEKIIIDSKSDLRYIKSVIDGLEYTKGKININKINNFAKDVELDTFNCIRFCADSENTLETKILHTSLYTNSTVFHNYPIIIDQSFKKPSDNTKNQLKETNITNIRNIELCLQIADMCCSSDEMVQYAFENQDWGSFEESYNILGTIGPLSILSKNDIHIGTLSYPSSNITVFKEDNVIFNNLEKESMMIKLILSRYYNGNKFIGDAKLFKNDFKKFKYPIQAYKLANITTDSKKHTIFLRDFKKRLATIMSDT